MIIRPVKTQIYNVKDQCNREIIQKVDRLLHRETQKEQVHTSTFYLATSKLQHIQRHMHFTLGKKNTYRYFLLYPSLFLFAPRMGIKYDINYNYTFKIEKLQLLIIFVFVQLQD